MPGVPRHTSGASQACSPSKVHAELRCPPARLPRPPARLTRPPAPPASPAKARAAPLAHVPFEAVPAGHVHRRLHRLVLPKPVDFGRAKQTDRPLVFPAVSPAPAPAARAAWITSSEAALAQQPLPAHSGSCCQPSAGFACKAGNLSCARRLSTSVQGSARPGPPHPPHLQQALCPAAILRDTAPACTACFCEQPWEAASLGPMWTQHPGQ